MRRWLKGVVVESACWGCSVGGSWGCFVERGWACFVERPGVDPGACCIYNIIYAECKDMTS